MPNIIDANGLQTSTRQEITDALTAELEAIYGTDINLASDTPDGQMLGIYVQGILDQLDLVTQVYNEFDPDNAVGRVLDQRVAINGIQRQGGSYTTTNIQVVTNLSNVYLPGLDDLTGLAPFTVSDNTGTEFVLTISQTIAAPGTYSYEFRALNPGKVLTIPNTINVPVTIVLGVQSVNNPTSYTTLGVNEESDMQLKIRRQKSVSLASQGYLAGLYAALNNIPGMVSAIVYENTKNYIVDTIPPHCIWVVVQGTAAASDIAQAIYAKRNAGADMKGDISYTITQLDGTPFEVNWSNVSTEALYIKFTASSLNGVNLPNIALIKAQLPNLLHPGVGGQVNINELATLVQEIDPNTLVTSAGFSLSATGPFTETLQASKANYFTLQSDDIIIIPIILSPASFSVATLGSIQYTPLGGFGPYTYSMQANPSGGSVNSSGLYTAGGISGIDIVKVVDDQGNIGLATVLVG